jgi:hypothetical protein
VVLGGAVPDSRGVYHQLTIRLTIGKPTAILKPPWLLWESKKLSLDNEIAAPET